MPDLSFRVDGIEVDANAATPLVVAKLRIANPEPAETIQNVVLRCQVQIEATRRRYTAGEQPRLRDLFGEPDQWSRTLRSLLWTHTSAMIPSFTGDTTVDLPLPCTFDFNVAATKYFHGLDDGEIPLLLLFSGSIFYSNADGQLQVAPISWDKESRCRLSVSVWRQMMDLYYPNSAWLRLRRDVFERLSGYRTERGLPTWEAAIGHLLAESEEPVEP